MARRRKIPCAVCHLPIVDGKDEAILCKESCKQLYHRGCASLPPERYKELSSTDEPFFCLICTCLTLKKEMSALSSTVTTLCEELQAALKMQESISTLKKEVSTLKEFLKDARCQLEEAKRSRPRLQSCSYADATNKAGAATGNWASISSQRNGTNKKSPPKHAKASSATQSKPGSDNIQHTGKCKVAGARSVWGTLPLITCTTVRSTISRLTQIGCVNEIQIRQKFVSRQSTRSAKDKWWFVLHGGEDMLQSLEEAWETVKLQTGWQLEQCTKPINAESPPSVEAAQSPPTENSCDHQVLNDTSTGANTTDTTIPYHSQTSTTCNSVPSLNQNQSSSSHSFLDTTQVTHPPPPLD